MRVVLREDQRLRHRSAPWEQLSEELLLERAEHHADLVLGHHVPIELLGRVLDRFVHLLPANRSLHPVAVAGVLAGLDLRAALGDRGLDDVDGEVHVDPIGDRQLVAVLHHEVLAEEAKGLLGWGGCQTDEMRIEILEDLPPCPVDRAVTLINDDHIEGVRWKLGLYSTVTGSDTGSS